MNKLYNIGFIALLLMLAKPAQSQVLISLLFGDKLNSDKIEFGLSGGENIGYLRDVSDSKGQNYFNLGFYFHIMLKDSSNTFISTGVMVKSSVGATGMATYPIGEPDLDSLYAPGTLTKKINYFYVPIMIQQRFNQRFYIEGGIMPGLRNKAFDTFTLDAYGGELSFQQDTRDQYYRLDFGLIGGVGYKLKRTLKSTAIGVSYYYGLVNVSKVDNLTLRNSSVYFYLKLPIGAKKAEEKKG